MRGLSSPSQTPRTAALFDSLRAEIAWAQHDDLLPDGSVLLPVAPLHVAESEMQWSHVEQSSSREPGQESSKKISSVS